MLSVILSGVQIILSIILIVVVLFQSGKQAGLSGSIAGGAETFFGKNKARTLDGILSRITTIVAILFIITSFVLSLILK
jgi:preprotein translocase subunit SecG